MVPKFQELKDKFKNSDPFDIEQVANWEKAWHEAAEEASLYEHEALVYLNSEITKQIDSINNVLLNKRILTEVDRNMMIARRDVYEWFQGLFRKPLNKMEEINKVVEENL